MFPQLEKTFKFNWKLVELLILVLFAAILRLWYINKADIGNDECFSLFFAQFHIRDTIGVLLQGDNPPFWEIVAHYWIIPWGSTAFSIRLLSCIFSILTVIPLYLTGEKFIHRYAGLLLSLLYALSRFSIFLAHDGRVYSLIGFLSAWSLYLFLSLIQKKKRSFLVWLTIVNILIMYGHYLALWLILMEFLIVLCFPTIRKTIGKEYLFHIAALVIAYLPMLPFLYQRFLDSGLHGTWISKNTGIEDLYSMLCCFSNDAVPAVFSLILLSAFLVKRIVLIVKKEYTPDYFSFINLIWCIPLLLSFALSFLVGFFYNRYFYFLLPIYLTSLTACVFYLFQDKKIITLTISLFFVVLWVGSTQIDSTKLRYGGWKGDTRTAVSEMTNLKAQLGAAVIIEPTWLEKEIVYYLDDNHRIFQTQGIPTEDPAFTTYLLNNDFYFSFNFDNESLWQHSHIIIICYNWYDISSLEEQLKEKGYQISKCEIFQQLRFSLFQKEKISH